MFPVKFFCVIVDGRSVRRHIKKRSEDVSVSGDILTLNQSSDVPRDNLPKRGAIHIVIRYASKEPYAQNFIYVGYLAFIHNYTMIVSRSEGRSGDEFLFTYTAR